MRSRISPGRSVLRQSGRGGLYDTGLLPRGCLLSIAPAYSAHTWDKARPVSDDDKQEQGGDEGKDTPPHTPARRTLNQAQQQFYKALSQVLRAFGHQAVLAHGGGIEDRKPSYHQQCE